MKGKKKKFLGPALTMLLVFFAVETARAASPVGYAPYNRPKPLMDYAPQELGTYDTLYENLSEDYCRQCHGDYHYTGNCMASGCHSWENTRDSTDPEFHGWHHLTPESGSRNCIYCHDSNLIGAFSPPVSFDADPPEVVPPTPYSCDNCHFAQEVASGHPSTYDGENPREYGTAIPINYFVHHVGWWGNVTLERCNDCHGDPFDWDHTNPELIRGCETCHTKDTLHDIHQQGYYGWEAVGFHVPDISNNDYTDLVPDTYRLFASNEMCSGCHVPDHLAVIREHTSGRQGLAIYEAPRDPGDENDPAVAQNGLFGHSGGGYNIIAMTCVSADGDAFDEIAVIRQMTNGRQRLEIYNASDVVGGETGSPIASDVSFGSATNNLNNIAMAGVDTDGDGIDAIAVIKQHTDGRQMLGIYNLPTTVGGETGPPIASDITFGNINNSGNNIAMAGLDMNCDGIDEIAVIKQGTDGGQMLGIYSLPTAVGGETGPPIASDLTFGSTSEWRNTAIAPIGY